MIKKLFIAYYLFFAVLNYFFLAESVSAAPPANFQTTQIIGSGLDGPSAFEFAPDGRIFILQRTGEIKIYKNNQLLSNNFAVLPSIASGDRGLIGIDFDPEFSANHYVYFYYTGLDKLNHVVRLDASTDVGTGETGIYHTNSPSEQLHVGGTVQFGPDGKLYFAVGDNGYGPNAQDLSNPHGKIMRINKDGTIPADNPFYGQPGKLSEIWAYGLRNPWRFQFDQITGELYDGDVGADAWEEINRIVKGGNYGWPVCEGKCTPANLAYIDPIYNYPHEANSVFQSSAVTQGPIYHGNMFPAEYQNNLFYGDYAQGVIRRLTFDNNGQVAGNFDFDMQAGSVVDLKTANDGSLYYITYYPGRMYRISYSTSSQIPVANAAADNLKGTNPHTVHFSGSGSYDPDGTSISYSWNFGDGTVSTDANPTKTYTQDGAYTVELTVSDGANNAQARPIIIEVGCPPAVTIGTPQNNSTYRSGDSITINASAVDCVGFDINDAALSTTVKFHHTTHIHPFLDNLRGRSHTFTVPTTGEPSADTWFEINVTATDTSGLSTTATININPVKSNMTFNTQPAGLQILIDGQPASTPQTIQAVVGYQREVNVSNAQHLAGSCYDFDHWSDGGAQRHTIATAQADTTFTAYFKQIACQSDPPLRYPIYDDALGQDWIDWSWGSGVNLVSPNAYTGTSAIAWSPNQAWSGLYVHRNEIPLDTTGYDAVTFSLKATQTGQPIEVQLYDAADRGIGQPVNIAGYGGDPTPDAYKVYSIPLSVLGGVNKQINGIHMQNVTDNPQPVMYVDRFGLTSEAIPTPTPTPTPPPTVGANLVINNSFENSGTTWLAPWKFDVWGTARGTIARDTTTKSDGAVSAKSAISKASANAIYQAQLYQSGILITANTSYTVSFSAKASSVRNIGVVLQQFGSPYTLYWQKTTALTTTWQKFSYTATPTVSDNNAFLGFNLASKTGNVWIDDVSICQGTCDAVPAPTPTPTPPPAVGPTPYNFFDDSLTAGWESWSWNAILDFAITNPVYTGSKAISFIAAVAWAGLDLHNTNGVDTTPYTKLHFALRASQSGQKYAVFMRDLSGNNLTTPISLADHGGDPTTSSWKVYEIPLATLNASNKRVYDVVIHEVLGVPQPAVYVDEIQLR